MSVQDCELLGQLDWRGGKLVVPAKTLEQLSVVLATPRSGLTSREDLKLNVFQQLEPDSEEPPVSHCCRLSEAPDGSVRLRLPPVFVADILDGARAYATLELLRQGMRLYIRAAANQAHRLPRSHVVIVLTQRLIMQARQEAQEPQQQQDQAATGPGPGELEFEAPATAARWLDKACSFPLPLHKAQAVPGDMLVLSPLWRSEIVRREGGSSDGAVEMGGRGVNGGSSARAVEGGEASNSSAGDCSGAGGSRCGDTAAAAGGQQMAADGQHAATEGQEAASREQEAAAEGQQAAARAPPSELQLRLLRALSHRSKVTSRYVAAVQVADENAPMQEAADEEQHVYGVWYSTQYKATGSGGAEGEAAASATTTATVAVVASTTAMLGASGGWGGRGTCAWVGGLPVEAQPQPGGSAATGGTGTAGNSGAAGSMAVAANKVAGSGAVDSGAAGSGAEALAPSGQNAVRCSIAVKMEGPQMRSEWQQHAAGSRLGPSRLVSACAATTATSSQPPKPEPEPKQLPPLAEAEGGLFSFNPVACETAELAQPLNVFLHLDSVPSSGLGLRMRRPSSLAGGCQQQDGGPGPCLPEPESADVTADEDEVPPQELCMLPLSQAAAMAAGATPLPEGETLAVRAVQPSTGSVVHVTSAPAAAMEQCEAAGSLDAQTGCAVPVLGEAAGAVADGPAGEGAAVTTAAATPTKQQRAAGGAVQLAQEEPPQVPAAHLLPPPPPPPLERQLQQPLLPSVHEEQQQASPRQSAAAEEQQPGMSLAEQGETATETRPWRHSTAATTGPPPLPLDLMEQSAMRQQLEPLQDQLCEVLPAMRRYCYGPAGDVLNASLSCLGMAAVLAAKELTERGTLVSQQLRGGQTVRLRLRDCPLPGLLVKVEVPGQRPSRAPAAAAADALVDWRDVSVVRLSFGRLLAALGHADADEETRSAFHVQLQRQGNGDWVVHPARLLVAAVLGDSASSGTLELLGRFGKLLLVAGEQEGALGGASQAITASAAAPQRRRRRQETSAAATAPRVHDLQQAQSAPRAGTAAPPAGAATSPEAIPIDAAAAGKQPRQKQPEPDVGRGTFPADLLLGAANDATALVACAASCACAPLAAGAASGSDAPSSERALAARSPAAGEQEAQQPRRDSGDVGHVGQAQQPKAVSAARATTASTSSAPSSAAAASTAHHVAAASSGGSAPKSDGSGGGQQQAASAEDTCSTEIGIHAQPHTEDDEDDLLRLDGQCCRAYNKKRLCALYPKWARTPLPGGTRHAYKALLLRVITPPELGFGPELEQTFPAFLHKERRSTGFIHLYLDSLWVVARELDWQAGTGQMDEKTARMVDTRQRAEEERTRRRLAVPRDYVVLRLTSSMLRQRSESLEFTAPAAAASWLGRGARWDVAGDGALLPQQPAPRAPQQPARPTASSPSKAPLHHHPVAAAVICALAMTEASVAQAHFKFAAGNSMPVGASGGVSSSEAQAVEPVDEGCKGGSRSSADTPSQQPLPPVFGEPQQYQQQELRRRLLLARRSLHPLQQHAPDTAAVEGPSDAPLQSEAAGRIVSPPLPRPLPLMARRLLLKGWPPATSCVNAGPTAAAAGDSASQAADTFLVAAAQDLVLTTASQQQSSFAFIGDEPLLRCERPAEAQEDPCGLPRVAGSAAAGIDEAGHQLPSPNGVASIHLLHGAVRPRSIITEPGPMSPPVQKPAGLVLHSSDGVLQQGMAVNGSQLSTAARAEETGPPAAASPPDLPSLQQPEAAAGESHLNQNQTGEDAFTREPEELGQRVQQQRAGGTGDQQLQQVTPQPPQPAVRDVQREPFSPPPSPPPARRHQLSDGGLVECQPAAQHLAAASSWGTLLPLTPSRCDPHSACAAAEPLQAACEHSPAIPCKRLLRALLAELSSKGPEMRRLCSGPAGDVVTERLQWLGMAAVIAAKELSKRGALQPQQLCGGKAVEMRFQNCPLPELLVQVWLPQLGSPAAAADVDWTQASALAACGQIVGAIKKASQQGDSAALARWFQALVVGDFNKICLDLLEEESGRNDSTRGAARLVWASLLPEAMGPRYYCHVQILEAHS
eukprot:XP_001698929.1 predicted protein [Chlamydomonas reinhardtii]